MKLKDFLVVGVVVVVFAPFFISEEAYHSFEYFTKEYGLIAAFIKFSLLATLGESIALRIRKGVYNEKGFGLLPRAIVWGFLGIMIKIAFVIFAKGTPYFLIYTGFEMPAENTLSVGAVVVAFSISTAMNLIFAPVMMTLHKITDSHIVAHSGKVSCLLKRIRFVHILRNLDWETHWNFVLKKTVPLFWIPAHTITFLLPNELRVLFAAILGIVLGLILAFAAGKK